MEWDRGTFGRVSLWSFGNRKEIGHLSKTRGSGGDTGVPSPKIPDLGGRFPGIPRDMALNLEARLGDRPRLGACGH